MDYSQLSDQEINAMVGKIFSKDGLSIIASDGNAVIHEYADCGEFKGICLGWKVFDPCNNPADAWPIIVDNKIKIEPVRRVRNYNEWYEEWDASVNSPHFCESHKNPLRAAMICFLLMQDANHA